MKRIFLVLATFFLAGFSFAQNLNPVSWTFSSKKIGDNLYEIHMVATMEKGWHVYSQNQPEGAVAEPTLFSFNKNPLVVFEGEVKEIGKLEKYFDKVLDATNHQYSKRVSFVQKIRLKGKAKTNITGSLRYQTCNDEKCLPSKTINLSIAI